MMKPNITYFRGLNHNEPWETIDYENLKVKALIEVAADFKPYPTCTDYDATEEYYKRALEDLDTAAENIVVGHSLGGFWAYKFATETGTPLILINPQLNPRYYEQDLKFCSDQETTVFLTTDDDQIPYEETLEIMIDHDVLNLTRIFNSGGHRFLDKENLDYLKRCINNYVPCMT